MPSVNVYLDEESYEMKKKIPKGKFSKIVQNAIKEHFGRDLDPEIIEEKIKGIKNKIEKDENEKKYLEKKAESMCIVEKEKLEIEKKDMKISMEKERKEEKEKKIKEFDSFLNKILELFIIDEKRAKELMKDYSDYKENRISNGKTLMGWANYFESKGVKRK